MFNHNQYFDGAVASLAFEDNGIAATVGVMKAGEYRFSTGAAERMTVVSGELSIKLEGSDNWQDYQAGGEFAIAANSYFDVKVVRDSSYLCHYLP